AAAELAAQAAADAAFYASQAAAGTAYSSAYGTASSAQTISDANANLTDLTAQAAAALADAKSAIQADDVYTDAEAADYDTEQKADAAALAAQQTADASSYAADVQTFDQQDPSPWADQASAQAAAALALQLTTSNQQLLLSDSMADFEKTREIATADAQAAWATAQSQDQYDQQTAANQYEHDLTVSQAQSAQTMAAAGAYYAAPPGVPGAPVDDTPVKLTGDYGHAHPIGKYEVGNTTASLVRVNASSSLNEVAAEMFGTGVSAAPPGTLIAGTAYSWMQGSTAGMPWGSTWGTMIQPPNPPPQIPIPLGQGSVVNPVGNWTTGGGGIGFGPGIYALAAQAPGNSGGQSGVPGGHVNDDATNNATVKRTARDLATNEQLRSDLLGMDQNAELNRSTAVTGRGIIETTTYPNRTEIRVFDKQGRYLGAFLINHEAYFAQETLQNENSARIELRDRHYLIGKARDALNQAEKEAVDRLLEGEKFGVRRFPEDPTGERANAEREGLLGPQSPPTPAVATSPDSAAVADPVAGPPDDRSLGEMIPIIGVLVSDFRGSVEALLFAAQIEQTFEYRRKIREFASRVLSDGTSTDEQVRLAEQLLAHPFSPDVVKVITELAKANASFAGLVMGMVTSTSAVYRSVNASGEVVYVGITNNFARRAAEHLRTKGIQIEKLVGGLSRSDSRAIEQALIEIYKLGANGGSLLNKINSIAASNPTYANQLQRGLDLLESIGYEAGM
ncbi:MAG TPA: GIY-YIG nuclease family protein, partial [Pirellulales bacterium]|nr:GIY-YIG nuclease family protein [Pirellulales bacterium]